MTLAPVANSAAARQSSRISIRSETAAAAVAAVARAATVDSQSEMQMRGFCGESIKADHSRAWTGESLTSTFVLEMPGGGFRAQMPRGSLGDAWRRRFKIAGAARGKHFFHAGRLQ